MQGNNLHIFYETLKPELKFQNLKFLKLGMPKKMTPKSQAKK